MPICTAVGAKDVKILKDTAFILEKLCAPGVAISNGNLSLPQLPEGTQDELRFCGSLHLIFQIPLLSHHQNSWQTLTLFVTKDVE